MNVFPATLLLSTSSRSLFTCRSHLVHAMYLTMHPRYIGGHGTLLEGPTSKRCHRPAIDMLALRQARLLSPCHLEMAFWLLTLRSSFFQESPPRALALNVSGRSANVPWLPLSILPKFPLCWVGKYPVSLLRTQPRGTGIHSL